MTWIINNMLKSFEFWLFITVHVFQGRGRNWFLWGSQTFQYGLHSVVGERSLPVVFFNNPADTTWITLTTRMGWVQRSVQHRCAHLPVHVVQRVWDFVNHFHSVAFGQFCHFPVAAQAVGLRVVLVRQLGHVPLFEQFRKHILWVASEYKKSAEIRWRRTWRLSRLKFHIEAKNQ